MIVQLHQGTMGFTRTDARIDLLLKIFVPNQTLDTNNNAINTTYDLFGKIFFNKTHSGRNFKAVFKMKNGESRCKYNNTNCQVINFAKQKQPLKTIVKFMSTAHILFYIESGTEALPLINYGEFSDTGVSKEIDSEYPSIPKNICIDIETPSKSQGEEQFTCAICSQVIQNKIEWGYVESIHKKCNLNYHHHCLMHAQECSFNIKKTVKCTKFVTRICMVYDSDKNVTYAHNEDTDDCIWCFCKLNTSFALGQIGCGQCKVKMQWRCLTAWANKTKEEGDLKKYFPFDNMYKCFVCKKWGNLQRLKHSD